MACGHDDHCRIFGDGQHFTRYPGRVGGHAAGSFGDERACERRVRSAAYRQQDSVHGHLHDRADRDLYRHFGSDRYHTV